MNDFADLAKMQLTVLTCEHKFQILTIGKNDLSEGFGVFERTLTTQEVEFPIVLGKWEDRMKFNERQRKNWGPWLNQ